MLGTKQGLETPQVEFLIFHPQGSQWYAICSSPISSLLVEVMAKTKLHYISLWGLLPWEAFKMVVVSVRDLEKSII